MWFKGLFVLCQAALLIAPTNAALQGQDGAAAKQNHKPRALSYGYLHAERRAPQHGGNQTRTSDQETETIVTTSPSPVVVPTTNVEATTPPAVPAVPITTTSTTSSSSSLITTSTSTTSTSTTPTSTTSTSTTSTSPTSTSTTSTSTTSTSPTLTSPILTSPTSTSTSTTVEDGVTTVNSTIPTDGIPTSENPTKLVPTTINEPTTNSPSRSPGDEITSTPPPAEQPKTSTRTSLTSENSPSPKPTDTEVPQIPTEVISPPLKPTETSTNTTADATTALTTTTRPPPLISIPDVQETPTTNSPSVSPTRDTEGKPTTGLVLGPSSNGLPSGSILNPTQEVTTDIGVTSADLPTTTGPLVLPSPIGELTDILNGTTSVDVDIPTILTTNSQGVPVVATSDLLPTITSGILPTLSGGLLPTVTPGDLPSITPGVLPTLSGGLIPTVTPGDLPSITTGVLPTLSGGLIPTLSGGLLPTVTPGDLPSITTGVLPTLSGGLIPTLSGGILPTVTPGDLPSITPGVIPSLTPGVLPSITPGVLPSITPGVIPSLDTDPSVNVTAGIPVSETLLTPLLPTTTPSIILPSTFVDTSNITPTKPATNVLPTQPLVNGTLADPSPSDGSVVTSARPSTGVSESGTGIPTTEDGPRTTLQPSPGSTAGGTKASSIVNPTSNSLGPSDVAGIPTGNNTTEVAVKETPTNPPSTIPTSETNIALDSDHKNDKPPVQESSVAQPTTGSAQPTGAAAQASKTSTQTSDVDPNPVTSDATFGTYMSTPTGYVPDTTTEPLVAFPTGPPTGKDSEAPPPPLTKQQTAGIAIGGTLSILMALVAALYIARRYHQNAANRNSTGSVYPEVAYLYDPPVGGNGDAEAGGAVPTMSGGNGGLVAAAALGRSSPRPHTVDYSTLPQNSPSYPPVGFGANNRPASAQISQDPFRDPGVDAQNATNAAAQQNPFRDPIVSVTKPSPRTEYAELAALAIRPYAQNPAASDYPPMSPYGSVMSEDPFADPFEHDNADLLLNVDIGTETEDSIVVVATPHTQHSPLAERHEHHVASPTLGDNSQYEPPAPCASHFPGRDSRCNSLIPGHYSLESRYVPDRHMSMSVPPVEPLRKLNPSFSSSTPSLLMSSQSGRATPHSYASTGASSRTTVTPEPITAPPRAASPPPTSRGWSDIMDEYLPIPEPLSMATTRKPVPLRRQPTLSGPGQILMATPLIIKKKPVAGATLAVPPSPYGPMPSKTETMSDDLTVQRKRSGELLFADPHLIGRPF